MIKERTAGVKLRYKIMQTIEKSESLAYLHMLD